MDPANAKTLADKLRGELEALAEQVRDLVLAQPQLELLGYLWSQYSVRTLQAHKGKEQSEPDPQLVKTMQGTLEYVHAVWSCYAGPYPTSGLDTAKADALITSTNALVDKAVVQAMASTLASTSTAFGAASQDIEVQAKQAWILIRGHRHQVLEEEFFKFVLAPHDDALVAAYGVGSAEIARGIQAIADSFRTGYGKAIESLFQRFDRFELLKRKEGLSDEAAAARIAADDSKFPGSAGDAYRDMFQGGICNVSRHTSLPQALFRAMAFDLGANSKFFAAGEYAGTPFRSLPARERPLIKLGDDYYATDGQFVRDSAYRCIQWGLLANQPQYREAWAKKQAAVVESAVPAILVRQLRDARFIRNVHFKDSATKEWVESDMVGIVGDTLLVIEAKAGVMAMHSPATNLEVHVRTIENLVIAAYDQCRRFLEYVASAPEVPLYELRDGNYVEIASLRKASLRKILPIGLTVEAFTPFSAMCKELPQIQPILGVHPFISMSVDDLFVLNRFLPTTGMLFHYLEVRQAVAGLRGAFMFDEMDHLGAYLQKNRFDIDMKEQLKSNQTVVWDRFSDRVDRHFEKEHWETEQVPTQPFPAGFQAILDALDRLRPAGWLAADSGLRDFGEEGRNNVANQIEALKKTIKIHKVRRIAFEGEVPLQIWLSCDLARPTEAEIRNAAELICLAFERPRTSVLLLDYDDRHQIRGVRCSSVAAPPAVRQDYAALVAEAASLRKKIKRLNK